MRFWVIYILVQVSFFGGLLWGILASVFFKFFVVGQPWWPTFLEQHPHHKKATYGTDLVGKFINC